MGIVYACGNNMESADIVSIVRGGCPTFFASLPKPVRFQTTAWHRERLATHRGAC